MYTQRVSALTITLFYSSYLENNAIPAFSLVRVTKISKKVSIIHESK